MLSLTFTTLLTTLQISHNKNPFSYISVGEIWKENAAIWLFLIHKQCRKTLKNAHEKSNFLCKFYCLTKWINYQSNMSNSQGFSPEKVTITLQSGVSQESSIYFMTFSLNTHSKKIARLFKHHVSSLNPNNLSFELYTLLYTAHVGSESKNHRKEICQWLKKPVIVTLLVNVFCYR